MGETGRKPNSVVLGAGLMGRLLSCELARNGHAVSLYEIAGADAKGSAAWAAAAMLAPLAESAVTEANVVRMGHYALTRWPQVLATLAQPVFFQQAGTLVVWHRQDAAEAASLARQLKVKQTRHGTTPNAQAVDASDIRKLEPSLENRFANGFFLPGEGQLDNRQLLDALLHQLQVLDIATHWHTSRSPGDFSPGQPGQPDWVFDCRGLGARLDWKSLRAVRGEVIRLQAPEVQLHRPVRLIHPRYPVYIAPKPDNIFVVGATEIESASQLPASVRSTLELLSAAYAVHSGFAEARILEIATQCRPTLPDNLPAIRLLAPRIVQINGLYRHGFLVAPAVLDAVMEIVQQGTRHLAKQFELETES